MATTRIREWRCLVAVVFALAYQSPVRADLFKYVNEDGVTVLDSHVPARYVRNGYTVLGSDGRVLEVVPRALTDEERSQQEVELAAQAEVQKALEERASKDRVLLQLYSTPEDVNRARDTKIASVNSFVQAIRNNLSNLKRQKRVLEEGAADIERVGRAVPAESLSRIDTLQGRINKTQREIDEKMAEIEDVKDSFAIDLNRLNELRN